LAAKNSNKKTNSGETRKIANYTLDNPTKITFEFLKAHLWSAADILRGALDASEFRQPIMTILFLKRLNDTFEENSERLEKKEGKSHKEAWENRYRHIFFVPKDARWSILSSTAEKETLEKRLTMFADS
jgi:type I restriction-modification system DNA methylase subunit